MEQVLAKSKKPAENKKLKFPNTRLILADAGYSPEFISTFLGDKRLVLHPEIKKHFREPKNEKEKEELHDHKNMDYEKYRLQVGVPQKIKDAKKFLKEHENELNGIESDFGEGTHYGVDRNYVVAVLAIESHFGKTTGTRDPVGVLVTLIEQVPWKREFGKTELLALLRFCSKNGIDPYSLKGSYAAALEFPQFLPSSLDSLFVDGNADGKLDPKNLSDSLCSIANYLKFYGWITGGSVTAGKKSIEEATANWIAIFKYNNDSNYVRAVKEIAEAIDLPYHFRKFRILKKSGIY